MSRFHWALTRFRAAGWPFAPPIRDPEKSPEFEATGVATRSDARLRDTDTGFSWISITCPPARARLPRHTRTRRPRSVVVTPSNHGRRHVRLPRGSPRRQARRARGQDRLPEGDARPRRARGARVHRRGRGGGQRDRPEDGARRHQGGCEREPPDAPLLHHRLRRDGAAVQQGDQPQPR